MHQEVEEVIPLRNDKRYVSWAKPLGRHGVIWLSICVCYSPLLLSGETIWDDDAFLRNPLLGSWQGLWQIWFQPRTNGFEEHYWPVTYTVAFFIRQLFGSSPLAFHALNVTLHAANASLVLAILEHWTKRYAFWVALVFAMHPTQVESVGWIVELKNLLSFFFAALSLLIYQRNEKHWHLAGLIPTCLGLFVTAMLSKSAVAPFPVLMLLIFWSVGGLNRKRLEFVGALLVVGILCTGFDVWFASQSGKLAPTFEWVERFIIAGLALGHYVRTWLWPVGLCAIYPKWALNSVAWAGGVAVWLSFAAFVTVCFIRSFKDRHCRRLFLWITGTFLMLLPTLGIISFSYQRQAFVADRFAYHASAIFFAGLVFLLATLFKKFMKNPLHFHMGFSVICALLVALTFQRAMAFRSVLLLSEDTAHKNPQAWTARYYRADIWARRGEFLRATYEYASVFWGTLAEYTREELQRLERDLAQRAPWDPHAAFTRGLLAARRNDFASAASAFDMATTLSSLRAQATLALAAIELRTGATTQAVERVISLYGERGQP